MKTLHKIEGYDFIDAADGGVWAIEKSTGEVTEAYYERIVKGSIVITPEEREHQKALKELQKRAELRKHANLPLGNFFYINMENDCISNIPSASLARLMFLASFMGFETNILMQKRKGMMGKTDIEKSLGLSKTGFYNFWSEAIKEGHIILEGERGFSMNPKLFHKGALKKSSM